MKKYCIAAFAAAVACVPAAANAKAYIDVHGGVDHVKISGAGSDNGASFGGAVGYEIPLGETVFVGVEAGIDGSSTKECASYQTFPPPPFSPATIEECVKAGRDLSAVVRLGTKLGGSTSVYVLGGYTNARIKYTYDDGLNRDSVSGNGDGFRLGAGFKLNFNERFYGKVEYRYSNYEAGVSRHNGLVGVGIEL